MTNYLPTFLALSESSQAVEALSNLEAAANIFSSVFSKSSSRLDTRLKTIFVTFVNNNCPPKSLTRASGDNLCNRFLEQNLNLLRAFISSSVAESCFSFSSSLSAVTDC